VWSRMICVCAPRTEERKSAAGRGVNLRRRTGERAELLGIQQRCVKAPGTRVEIDLLVQGRATTLRPWSGWKSSLLPHVLSTRAFDTQSTDHERSPNDKLASSRHFDPTSCCLFLIQHVAHLCFISICHVEVIA